MASLLPVLVITLPLLFAYSAISLYRTIYPYELVKK
jgi:hypothetical protein